MLNRTVYYPIRVKIRVLFFLPKDSKAFVLLACMSAIPTPCLTSQVGTIQRLNQHETPGVSFDRTLLATQACTHSHEQSPGFLRILSQFDAHIFHGAIAIVMLPHIRKAHVLLGSARLSGFILDVPSWHYTALGGAQIPRRPFLNTRLYSYGQSLFLLHIFVRVWCPLYFTQ